MLKHDFRDTSFGGADDKAGLDEFRKSEVDPGKVPGDVATLAKSEREQLARDIAAIEHATAALRKAEPALESWTGEPIPVAMPKAPPVWLMIGLLWLSAAVVTAGAAAAIVALVD